MKLTKLPLTLIHPPVIHPPAVLENLPVEKYAQRKRIGQQMLAAGIDVADIFLQQLLKDAQRPALDGIARGSIPLPCAALFKGASDPSGALREGQVVLAQ